MENIGKKVKLSDFIKLPIEIKSDDEYAKALKEALENYGKWVEVFVQASIGYLNELSDDKKRDIIKNIKNDSIAIRKSLSFYCKGRVDYASSMILGLLKRIIEGDTNDFIVSEIDKSYSTRLISCFPNIYDVDNEELKRIREEELTLYRARTEYFTDYSEMYHIPLNKRDKVGTERFSIPGIPCLYVGTSIYDVWQEMGRPAYSDFNVSAIKLTEEGKKLKLLNLAINSYTLMGMDTRVNSNDSNTKEKVQLIISMLRLYPLVIATSFRNSGSKGKFRSEYVISQLIMLNLQRIGCHGIAYISKRVEDNCEDYSLPQMVNLAFPAYNPSEKNKLYGTICEKIKITKPQNYEEFMSLELGAVERMEKHSYYARTYLLNRPHNSITYINCCGRIIDYSKTIFYRFENNLCRQIFYEIPNGNT